MIFCLNAADSADLAADSAVDSAADSAGGFGGRGRLMALMRVVFYKIVFAFVIGFAPVFGEAAAAQEARAQVFRSLGTLHITERFATSVVDGSLPLSAFIEQLRAVPQEVGAFTDVHEYFALLTPSGNNLSPISISSGGGLQFNLNYTAQPGDVMRFFDRLDRRAVSRLDIFVRVYERQEGGRLVRYLAAGDGGVHPPSVRQFKTADELEEGEFFLDSSFEPVSVMMEENVGYMPPPDSVTVTTIVQEEIVREITLEVTTTVQNSQVSTVTTTVAGNAMTTTVTMFAEMEVVREIRTTVETVINQEITTVVEVTTTGQTEDVGVTVRTEVIREITATVQNPITLKVTTTVASELALVERARRALLELSREPPEDLDLWQDLHLRLRSEGLLGARPHAAPARLRTPRSWGGLVRVGGAIAAACVLGVSAWLMRAPETAPAGPAGPNEATLARVDAELSEPNTSATSASATDTTNEPGRIEGVRRLRRGVDERTRVLDAQPVSFGPDSFGPTAHTSAHQHRHNVGAGWHVMPRLPHAAANAQPSTSAAAPASGGLRRATRQDELLRNSALPWRQFFHRARNVPIYLGENAAAGFGLR